MNGYLRQVWAVVRKDFLVEMRTRERGAAMAGFAVLVTVLVNFSLDTALVRPGDVAAGWIWMTILFAGLLGLGRTFELEGEDGAFRGLLLAPVPRDAIYLGKVVANFFLTFGVALVVLGAFLLFFSLDLHGNGLAVLGVLALGTLGFTATATLLSGVSAGTTMGETVLPILVFPLLVPLIIFGVNATGGLMAGLPVDAYGGNLRVLAAYDLVALAAGAGLFRFIVED